MYCLTRKTLECNSLVQKICMFLQKETSYGKSSFALGPQGPKHYIFCDHFCLKNARRLKFHVFLLFHARKHVISSFYLQSTEFIRYCEFCSNRESQGTQNELAKIHNLLWIRSTDDIKWWYLDKWWYHMFSSIKMEEYMEFQLSGIFWVKAINKKIVLVSLGTHFMHIRVKTDIY